MKTSYQLWIRFGGRRLGLVWQTNDGTQAAEDDGDGVLVNNGRIVSVRTPEAFSIIAREYGLDLDEENTEPQNLDALERLLELPMSDDTCSRILNAWNLFNDIARSVGATLNDRSPDADRCYDKLFAGNNLDSITPSSDHYSPYFGDGERGLIAEILDRGRTILAAHV